MNFFKTNLEGIAMKANTIVICWNNQSVKVTVKGNNRIIDDSTENSVFTAQTNTDTDTRTIRFASCK